MGIEEKIASLLSQGHTPQSIMRDHGFKKSTIYKVYHSLRPKTMQVTRPLWVIQNVTFDSSPYSPGDNRFLPGQAVNLMYELKNTFNLDLYVYRVGVQPEWLKDKWHAKEDRFLLRPGEARKLGLTFPIPTDTPLGEYDLRFGIEGQFMSPGMPFSGNLNQTQWSEPLVFGVKRRLSGYRVFISHSTQDMYLVRQLHIYLDSNGIEGVVAEDYPEPGVRLTQKFERNIDTCQLFLALLTANAVRSKWVLHEINYALRTNKPLILLKEDTVKLDLDAEWIEFSRYESVRSVAQKVMNATANILQGPSRPATPQSALISGAIVGGLIAFFVGLAMGASKEQVKTFDS